MNRDLKELSPALRATLEELADDSESLVDRALRAIFEEVSEYPASPAPDLPEGVRAMVAHNVDLWYDALLTGTRPTSRRLEPLDTFARERVYQKIPLDALLRAFRVGGVAFCQALLDAARERPEIQSEILFEVMPYSLVHLDIVSHTIGNAYLGELGNQTRRHDRLTHELLQVVFTGDGGADAFEGRLAALGLDTRRGYCALVMRPRGGATDGDIDAEGQGHRRLREALSRLGIAADSAIHTVRHGYLAIWLPAPISDGGDWERSLIERVETMLQRKGVADAAGIGASASGPEGWRASYEQAVRALEIGSRMTGEGRVYRYYDLALYDVALRTPELSIFLRTVLERLATEDELLASLDSYFVHGRHVKTAAADLGIHPNTLSYRLRRVEELLDGRLDDSDWAMRLQLALKLRSVDVAARESA